MVRKNVYIEKNELFFLLGLIGYFLLNLFQAIVTPIHADEAFYLMYSKNMSFGFYEHPPLNAFAIKLGSLLFNGTLGIRFFTILFSTATVFLLWQLVKPFQPTILLFWSIYFSIIAFQPYSFIATPDAPLLLFTALFFYLFRSYLSSDNLRTALLLAITIALMLYSKYHGILVIAFAIAATRKLLFKRKSFYIIIAVSSLLMIPHLVWQIENNFPTFTKHLIERNTQSYQLTDTLGYIASQLAIAGPFLGWWFLWITTKSKSKIAWEYTLKIEAIGIFAFFLLATISGNYEAHWTLVAFIPVFILTYHYFASNQQLQRIVKITGIASFCLIIIIRISIPIIEQTGGNNRLIQRYFGWEKAMKELQNKTENLPIVFQDQWDIASLYSFYSNCNNCTCINSCMGHANQYDLIPWEEELKGKTAYIVSSDSSQFNSFQTIKTSRGTFYSKKVEHFISYNKIELKAQKSSISVSNRIISVDATLHNPYRETVTIGEKTAIPASLRCYFYYNKRWKLADTKPISILKIEAGQTIALNPYFELPDSLTGRYQIMIALKLGDFKAAPSTIKTVVDLN